MFKKSSLLSVFLIFSVVAVTVPLRVSAEPYTGELQLQNTRVLPDYRAASGYGQTTLNALDGAYLPRPGSFSARENNNFISSLTQKTFSASVENDVLNCTGDDINLTANNGILLTYISSDTGYSGSDGDPLCLPVRTTAQNTTTTLTNEGSGNSYGGLGVVQSYYLIPAPLLGEAEQITSVESLPNDPNNVRVTVTDNYTREGYVIRFTRQADVQTVYNFVPAWAQYPEYGAIVRDGKTYVINWTSDWVGQVPISLGDDYGTVIWGDPSTYSCDEGNRCTMDPLFVNTGYPTPQISQFEATFISASSSVIRPRNSDVIAVTQPQCTRGGSSGFWSSTVWISCTTYGLSADGRTGTANYYHEESGRGWFFELLGITLAVIGIATGFAELFAASGGFAASFGSLYNLSGLITGPVGLASLNVSPTAVAAVGALAASTLQTIATSPTSLGTVERAGNLGVGSWSWTPSSPFVPTCPAGQTGTPPNCVGALTNVSPVPTCPIGQTGTPPNCVGTLLNPAPAITNVSPNSATAGTGFTLTVNGTNFVPSSVINFDGAPKTTSFASTTQLTASIPASDITTAGAYPVTVTNPTPGGGTSNSQTFTATTPPPPLPSCVFSATPSAIVPPQSSSLSWNCGNANSCSIDNGIGSVGVNGSSIVKPSQTTTYTLSCNGAGGSASFQTTVRTTRFDIKEVAP